MVIKTLGRYLHDYLKDRVSFESRTAVYWRVTLHSPTQDIIDSIRITALREITAGELPANPLVLKLTP